MNNTKKVLISIAVLAVVFTAGRFSKPAKIQEKIVVKTETVKVEGKTKIVHRDKITKPDGTIIEKEVEREDTNTREESKSVASSEKKITNDSGLVLSALAVAPIKDIGGEREYALVASKRVIGALNVTAQVTTDKKIGLGLGWSF